MWQPLYAAALSFSSVVAGLQTGAPASGFI
jgi:hypothetical protein